MVTPGESCPAAETWRGFFTEPKTTNKVVLSVLGGAVSLAATVAAIGKGLGWF